MNQIQALIGLIAAANFSATQSNMQTLVHGEPFNPNQDAAIIHPTSNLEVAMINFRSGKRESSECNLLAARLLPLITIPANEVEVTQLTEPVYFDDKKTEYGVTVTVSIKLLAPATSLTNEDADNDDDTEN